MGSWKHDFLGTPGIASSLLAYTSLHGDGLEYRCCRVSLGKKLLLVHILARLAVYVPIVPIYAAPLPSSAAQALHLWHLLSRHHLINAVKHERGVPYMMRARIGLMTRRYMAGRPTMRRRNWATDMRTVIMATIATVPRGRRWRSWTVVPIPA